LQAFFSFNGASLVHFQVQIQTKTASII